MASFEKRGNYWRFKVHYKDEFGDKKYITQSGFRTKAEAKKAALEVELNLKNGFKEYVNFTLEQWLDYYLETWRKDKISQSTFEIELYAKRRLLTYYDPNIKIKDITPSMHQKFINTLIEHGYSKSTLSKTHNLLKRAMERAKYDRHIYFNPCDGITLQHKNLKERDKAKYLPKDKIKPFLDMVKKRDIYQYFLFRTLIETGMRIGEASALSWQDYDRKAKTISITKSYDQKRNQFGATKNKENRIIFISDTLSKELFKLKSLQNANKLANSELYNMSYDFMFCNEFGDPLPRSTTHNTMKYVTGKILGKGNELSIHKLRHTHATLLLESNVPMKVIQERLGHKSEFITSNVYSHVTEQMNHNAKDNFETYIRDIF
ncbi:site-specific integrase [Staphylococcus simiae]|uniref:site-specific integrase n=1 Tax=Staphylococcus simiae TaxID=308354 RepID=UPI001A96048D|nr:tyrosine-type recombinase/integrase [Staphylococcus simiae]MBO1199084.1 site-specific integrase [Staphylococcus simiae]MBO1201208.1 site-specific integrase [Staphylococcus simiae]MBO1203357.1 site-specific integrase [Staphylococcus simiae]MBO1210884.1 site-specific integrase [Staphylococcus simiae]MBO1229522.1 site-specific integrase [Staphylococcus simiae]